MLKDVSMMIREMTLRTYTASTKNGVICEVTPAKLLYTVNQDVGGFTMQASIMVMFVTLNSKVILMYQNVNNGGVIIISALKLSRGIGGLYGSPTFCIHYKELLNLNKKRFEFHKVHT